MVGVFVFNDIEVDEEYNNNKIGKFKYDENLKIWKFKIKKNILIFLLLFLISVVVIINLVFIKYIFGCIELDYI